MCEHKYSSVHECTITKVPQHHVNSRSQTHVARLDGDSPYPLRYPATLSYIFYVGELYICELQLIKSVIKNTTFLLLSVFSGTEL